MRNTSLHQAQSNPDGSFFEESGEGPFGICIVAFGEKPPKSKKGGVIVSLHERHSLIAAC